MFSARTDYLGHRGKEDGTTDLQKFSMAGLVKACARFYARRRDRKAKRTPGTICESVQGI